MATGPLFVPPLFQPQNDEGLSIPGGLLSFFLGDSSTPSPVYSNQALTIALTQPVEADDTGTFPKIFIDPTVTYKVVLTGPDDGIVAPTEYFSVYPYKLAWPETQTTYFDLPFSWPNAAPEASEILAIYTAVRPQRFPSNFDGTADGYKKAWGNVITAPSVEQIVRCYHLNVTLKGYMRIAATTGAIDFFTDAGAPFDLDTGEFITWRAVDASTLATLSWTITGINL